MKKLIVMLLTLILVVSAVSPAALAWSADRMEAADELYELGVFRGTEEGYALDRGLTRQEAAILLVRLLGREEVAVSGQWQSSFVDVSPWAYNYVSYAYCAGLSTGYDALHFGGTDAVTGAQFVALLLRALGYRDGTDFVWNNPWKLAVQLGLCDAGETFADGFTRGDAAYLCANALDKPVYGTSITLRRQLSGPAASRILTPTEIADRCNSAVFKLTVYRDKTRQIPKSTGSAFFISEDGIAVTNYHVIEDGVAAEALMISGETYPVLGVISADQANDLAILRIDMTSLSGNTVSKFPTLTMGGSASMRSGNVVYTIGCPLGYSNTVAEGLVSNMSRLYDGHNYIQISAPISTGSSGGPVINDRGLVVAVVTATFNNGQNMNLTLPIELVHAMDRDGEALAIDEYFIKYPKVVVADEDCVITADTSEIIFRVGEARRVLISTDCDSEFFFHFDCDEDEELVLVEWGKWVGTKQAHLYVTALAPGETEIIVDFMKNTGNPDAKAKISVTVLPEDAALDIN